MEKATSTKILAVLAIIVGPFIAYIGHQEKEMLAKLDKEGVTVDGIIEGGESRKSGKSGKSYVLEVAYTPANGVALKQNFKVTKAYFSAHTDENNITDPAVKVRYLTGEIQDSAILVGGSTDHALMFPIGLVILGAGLLTAIYMFMIKK